MTLLGLTDVHGNYVGLNAAGTGAIPNLNGVAASTQSRIGGATPSPGTAAGNVISGNLAAGVLISGDHAGNVEVDGNLVGTDPAGASALANADGVVIEDGATSALLGFTARNVISGNDFAGVLIRDTPFGFNTLVENRIGLDRAGTGAIPNGIGVELAAGARNNRVGRAESVGKRNAIAGNRSEGIKIHGTGTELNEVVRAYVGLRLNGARLPNGTGVVISMGRRATRSAGLPPSSPTRSPATSRTACGSAAPRPTATWSAATRSAPRRAGPRRSGTPSASASPAVRTSTRSAGRSTPRAARSPATGRRASGCRARRRWATTCRGI